MSDMTVEAIMQASPLACPTSTPVSEAARTMHAAACSCLVVTEDGKPVGIWTEHDVLAVEFASPGGLNRPLREVMSSPIKTIPRGATVRESTARMKEFGLRHLLVIDDDGGVAGILSQSDIVLAHGIECYLRLKEVGTAVRRQPVIVETSAEVAEAARLMRECRLDALLVRYADGSMGILTERDIVRCLGRGMLKRTVGEVASRPLISVGDRLSLHEARRILAEHHLRHLAVLNAAGDVIGVMSFRDLLIAVDQHYVEEIQASLRQSDDALALSRGRLRLAAKVVETSIEGIVVTDAEGIIQSANPAFQRLTGYEEVELIGRSAGFLASGRHDGEFFRRMWEELRAKGFWKGEVWNRRKNGEVYLKTVTITGIADRNGPHSNFVAVHSDVASHEESAERIHSLSTRDALTGLPNRALFSERLDQSLVRARRAGATVTVMMVDIDGFKEINELYGYPSGDELLQATAARLAATLGEGDLVARLTADEFGIVSDNLLGAEEAGQYAQRLLDRLAEPLEIAGHPLQVTASLGASLYPGDAVDATCLFQHAGTALSQAKRHGSNTYRFFTEEMNWRARRRLAIERELRRAIEQGALEVYYQPKVEMRSMRVVGAEALVRWRHPDHGMIPPSVFIPVAEEAGMVAGINEHVMRTACKQARAWQDIGLPPMSVAVNLSSSQFQSRRLIETVGDALSTARLQPSLLELEITESMAINDVKETRSILGALAESGVAVAIDDFGTGYSSFMYLKQFPVDTLKIDRMFVKDIRKAGDEAIPAAMTAMAHSLGMKVVAEGIESSIQVDALAACGCDIGQGYHFSYPLPAEGFTAFCRRAVVATGPIQHLAALP